MTEVLPLRCPRPLGLSRLCTPQDGERTDPFVATKARGSIDCTVGGAKSHGDKNNLVVLDVQN